jgi:hypothetical protein
VQFLRGRGDADTRLFFHDAQEFDLGPAQGKPRLGTHSSTDHAAQPQHNSQELFGQCQVACIGHVTKVALVQSY